MAKKEHTKWTVKDRKVEQDDCSGKSDDVEIVIPKGMPYVKVRRALEIALLRIR